jgi:hypothetical protein
MGVVRTTPTPTPQPDDPTEFRPLRSLAGAAWVGVVTYGGVVYRSVAIEGETFDTAVRASIPVGPAIAGLCLALSWIVPTFNRYFPRRTD